MNKSVVIIVGALLFVFGLQVLMFYRTHQKLYQRLPLESNLSCHQSSDTLIQDADNWNSYQELLQMRNQMVQMFNDSMSRFHKNSTADYFTQMPAIDLKDETDRYVVKVDVPGADESSLDVALDSRYLTISIKTENVSEQTDDNNKYQLRERFRGEFQRSLTLPGDVDSDDIKTEYNDGVLTIIFLKV